MDIDYSALVAFGVSFLDFLPVFGMGAVLWPWMSIDIIGANYTEAILLGVLYGICQLIRQVLQPKLVSDAVEMNPLLTLIFMYIGYKLMNGIWGLILGIPIGMVIVSLFRIGAFDRLTKGIKIIVKMINDFRKY
jgi:predicted PurR-regulated permease PerM